MYYVQSASRTSVYSIYVESCSASKIRIYSIHLTLLYIAFMKFFLMIHPFFLKRLNTQNVIFGIAIFFVFRHAITSWFLHLIRKILRSSSGAKSRTAERARAVMDFISNCCATSCGTSLLPLNFISLEPFIIFRLCSRYDKISYFGLCEMRR